jgi:hypothetical protein
MTYVPEYQCDVFISYAVADNIKPAEGKPGWVDVFERQLKLELQKEVTHKRPVEVWRDTKRLSCGDNFGDEIREAASNAAVLVVLLSKQYLASPWCQKERETFLNAAAAQGITTKRLFVVELTDPKRFAQLPDGLADLHHVSLWRHDGSVPKQLGHPVPDHQKSEHQGFFDRVLDIAFAIAERLDEFPATATTAADRGESKSTKAANSTPVSGPAVYLAAAPKSTKEEAFTSELKSALENAIPPVRVIQPQKLPAAGEDTQTLAADLKNCQLYVQVVGYVAPPRQGIQKKLAEEASLPLLFWKGEDVDVSEVEDNGLKTLVQQARLGTVEDAKQAIIEKLAELTKPKTSMAPKRQVGETLFINHLPEDKELAQLVFNRLSARFECIKRPLSGASESELRAYFEQKLLECDHMVMVYGKASRLSANEQVRSCFKVVSSNRPVSDAIADWFVVVGPPQPSDADLELDVGCRGFRLHAIDGRNDLEKSLELAFDQFQQGGRG